MGNPVPHARHTETLDALRCTLCYWGCTVLSLLCPPNIHTSVLTCTDMMCGIGAFHQAVRAFISWAQQNAQPHQAHTLLCTLAMDTQPTTTAVYSVNYPGTPTVTVNVTDPSSWPAPASPTHLLLAGPPCQGWSPAGYMLQWLDTRSLPLAMLPLIAWSWGNTAALIEQVPAFIETGLEE